MIAVQLDVVLDGKAEDALDAEGGVLEACARTICNCRPATNTRHETCEHMRLVATFHARVWLHGHLLARNEGHEGYAIAFIGDVGDETRLQVAGQRRCCLF